MQNVSSEDSDQTAQMRGLVEYLLGAHIRRYVVSRYVEKTNDMMSFFLDMVLFS